MQKQKIVLMVHGPTGVGKTAFVDELGKMFSIEIINGDMGQLYTPLTIGTAKPNWRTHAIPHHCFDQLDEPVLFSVIKYRRMIKTKIEEIWDREKLPVIVGGSSFYILSLFFPPHEYEKEIISHTYKNHEILWDELNAIDPERAAQIDAGDTYRIIRALDIWKSTGVKPSEYAPQYNPVAPYHIIWLDRDRDDLYERINTRVIKMIDEGWIKEVEALRNTPWESFLYDKKIIGYDLILSYLAETMNYKALIQAIQKQTRNYAKRQIIFWRMLKKRLENALQKGDNTSSVKRSITTINLTHSSLDRYIKQLKELYNANENA